ncbi:MAG: type II toxin-antitoxin system RelE/ParE family toxin [Candidatus Peribacteria bacterium]|jgi:plasmid maintenance system killer protein|nr:type II toxin-antitoxin system RelE/ParE family toxin [Candidatus Peribacteria bacterium]
MIQLIFKHKELEYLYRDEDYRHRKMSYEIQRSYVKKCRYLEHMNSIQELYDLKSLHYEKYKAYHSIRINQQWRIVFDVDNVGKITVIEIIDVNNHYQPNF